MFEVWVCSKFGFVESLGSCEVWVCSKLGFGRSLGLFDSTDAVFQLVYLYQILL